MLYKCEADYLTRGKSGRCRRNQRKQIPQKAESPFCHTRARGSREVEGKDTENRALSKWSLKPWSGVGWGFSECNRRLPGNERSSLPHKGCWCYHSCSGLCVESLKGQNDRVPLRWLCLSSLVASLPEVYGNKSSVQAL